jgi:hypothetical protein
MPLHDQPHTAEFQMLTSPVQRCQEKPTPPSSVLVVLVDEKDNLFLSDLVRIVDEGGVPEDLRTQAKDEMGISRILR